MPERKHVGRGNKKVKIQYIRDNYEEQPAIWSTDMEICWKKDGS